MFFFINGRLIIVSCTYPLQHYFLHNKKENDKRILCSCKIFGWECVGDSIPVKPAIPFCMQLPFAHSILWIRSSLVPNFCFCVASLLWSLKISKQRESSKTESIEYRGCSRGKHDVVILDCLRYQHSFFPFYLISQA